MIDIFIAGDFGYRNRVAQKIEAGNGIDLFENIQSQIAQADYSIVNLESPVGSVKDRINKCGPSIFCKEEAITVLKQIGFDMVTLANNHFYDCGQSGVERTIECCKKNGLDTIGGGKNLNEANTIKTIDIKGKKISFINVCENEFSLATDYHGGSKHLDPISQYYEIHNANRVSDYIIVIVHGGHEYYQLPSPRMQNIYRFFIDAGASAVVNHHQHCFSGFEIYKGKPIFYGLGNFCFDSSDNKRNHEWNRGFAVVLSLNNSNIDYNLISYIQCDDSAGIRTMTDLELKDFQLRLYELNEIISNPYKLKSAFSKFVTSSQENINIFNPFFNGITSRIYKYKWFPSLITKKQRMLQLHYIQCESHRDKLLAAMRNNLCLK